MLATDLKAKLTKQTTGFTEEPQPEKYSIDAEAFTFTISVQQIMRGLRTARVKGDSFTVAMILVRDVAIRK
jgi:hypothetical protein